MNWLIFAGFHSKKRAQRRAFISSYAWPAGLTRRFGEKHPGLSAANCDLAFDGLRQYFRVCLAADKRMISMPSQVVDDAWHEFLLYTRDYNEFCEAAFGRFLHHTPAEAMQAPTSAQDGIRRAWRLSCRDENIDPNRPERLPLLFAIDAALQIPGGFFYNLDCLPFNQTPGRDGTTYCATHIGCGGGCSSDGGDSSGTHSSSHVGHAHSDGGHGSHAHSDGGHGSHTHSDGGHDGGDGGSHGCGGDSGGSSCGSGCGGGGD